MKKRGATHVDWVISMSIFLLGVLTLIIFVLPLFNEPLNSEDTLLPIIEEKFVDDTYWIIKRVPLFVTSRNPSCDNGNIEVTINFEDGWYLPDGTKQEILTDPGVGEYWYSLHRDDYLNYEDLRTELDVDPGHCEEDPEQTYIYVGAGQNRIGISTTFLDEFRDKDYDDLRGEWNYPLANDFAIYVNDEKFPSGAPDAPGNINIFVSQYRDFIVDDEGNLTEVVVSLRAW